MLSLSFLKLLFDELYASSLALFYLCLNIVLRSFKPNPPGNPGTISSARDFDRSREATTLDKQTSYGTCDAVSFPTRQLVGSPIVPEVTKQSAASSRAPTQEVEALAPFSTSKSRKAYCVALGSPVKKVVVAKSSLTKSKYSFKRKRHSSQRSPIPGALGSHVQTPVTIVSIEDRIKSKRRSALRPMLLIHDPTIDLRPLLLPEHVLQRTNAKSDDVLSIPPYLFQTPSQPGSHWQFDIPEIRVEEVQFQVTDLDRDAAARFAFGGYMETNYLMV